MLPHQERVITEKADLDDKLIRLSEFCCGPVFQGLPQEEKQLLTAQETKMREYSAILGQRIQAFGAE